MSAVERNILDVMDKVVMDDWGQAHGKFGSLREHVDSGLLTAETLHAELGDIVAEKKCGRINDNENIINVLMIEMEIVMKEKTVFNSFLLEKLNG